MHSWGIRMPEQIEQIEIPGYNTVIPNSVWARDLVPGEEGFDSDAAVRNFFLLEKHSLPKRVDIIAYIQRKV